MTDNLLNATVLALMTAVASAAFVTMDRSGHHDTAASVADMTVVQLPMVLVAGKRQAPADNLAVASHAGLQVVRLPLVTVSGRRVPAMEAVTLARAQ